MLIAGMIKITANAEISFVRILLNKIVLPLHYELFLATSYFVRSPSILILK